jgi:hypothetical protein
MYINPGCKDLVYFTKKRMIGDTVYFMNFEKGLLKNEWTFHNELRKSFDQEITHPNSFLVKGQEECSTFATNDAQTLFAFAGHYKKFGKKKPFISIFELEMIAGINKLRHLDTQIIENYEGQVSHILIDCHPTNKNDIVIAGVNGHVMVLEIRNKTLKPVSNHKDLHLGSIMNMRIFTNKVLTCGEDGAIRCFKYKNRD